MYKYLILSIMAAALSVAGADFRFDCGSPASPLMPGFKRLTPAGGDGAAWKGAGLTAGEQPIPPLSPSPQIYLNELTCDYVTSHAPAELTLSVPPGKYKVWIAMGNPNGHVSQVWNTVVASSVEQKETNISGKYGMRAFTLSAEADAGGLKLNISTQSRWLLNTVIAVPEAEYEQTYKASIAPLWNEIMTFPPAEAKKWKMLPPPMLIHHPEPKWSAENLANGYALFARAWCEPVWQTEFPRQSELDAPVRMFAAPDEFETTSFTIHALKDFKEIDLKAGVLADAAGNTLPLDTHYIRYMFIRSYYNTRGTYFEGPDVVMPWSPQSLDKGRNLRIWLTAHVPENAVPGDYKGTVEVTLDGKIQQVPVSLKVLPIKLYKNPKYVFGLYYRPAANFFSSAPDAYSLKWWQGRYDAELDDMKNTGFNMLMNGIGLHLQHANKTVAKLAAHGINREAPVAIPARALYKKHMGEPLIHHFTNLKMPPDAYFTEFQEHIRAIIKLSQGQNWPEMLFYVADEPNSADLSRQFLLRLLKAVRAEGGKTLLAAELSKPVFEELYPYVDVWSTHDFSLPPDELAALKQRYPHMRFWVYPNTAAASNDHVVPVAARMTFGFGLWMSGFEGLMPWIYQHTEGDQWNNLDGSTADCMSKTGDNGAPIAVTNWVAFREGIDDGRYIYTLERLIDAAARAGHQAEADAAAKVLKDIRDAVPVEEFYRRENVWEGGSLDAARYQVAQQILKLQKLASVE